MRLRVLALIISIGVVFSPNLVTPALAQQAIEVLSIACAATSASDKTLVKLDADLYLPETTPAPAIVLAHGFGGSKT